MFYYIYSEVLARNLLVGPGPLRRRPVQLPVLRPCRAEWAAHSQVYSESARDVSACHVKTGFIFKKPELAQVPKSSLRLPAARAIKLKPEAQ